jgi:3'-5' exonuclease
MLEPLKIGNILFLDIETVPCHPSYDQLPERDKAFWDKKARYLKKEEEEPEVLYEKAGIYAEFGKIICISTGMIGLNNNQSTIRIKSFYGENESILLQAFSDLVIRLCQKKEIELCAHNGKEFDFPFIARRLLVNGIKLPELLETSGKRPWEVRHLDTMELWKFGDHKHYVSLDLLASLFGIDSPKNDIDGSQVAQVYWKEHDLKRIVEYCRRDVVTVAQLLLHYKGEPKLEENGITVLDNL